jgi:type I restriction enzyme R subunit
MSQELPSFLEDHISQIPALQLLQNLGWNYLMPADTVAFRSGKPSNVILEEVLVEQLRKLNRIHFKGQEYPTFRTSACDYLRFSGRGEP